MITDQDYLFNFYEKSNNCIKRYNWEIVDDQVILNNRKINIYNFIEIWKYSVSNIEKHDFGYISFLNDINNAIVKLLGRNSPVRSVETLDLVGIEMSPFFPDEWYLPKFADWNTYPYTLRKFNTILGKKFLNYTSINEMSDIIRKYTHLTNENFIFFIDFKNEIYFIQNLNDGLLTKSIFNQKFLYYSDRLSRKKKEVCIKLLCIEININKGIGVYKRKHKFKNLFYDRHSEPLLLF